jgi:hypothetical protein
MVYRTTPSSRTRGNGNTPLRGYRASDDPVVRGNPGRTARSGPGDATWYQRPAPLSAAALSAAALSAAV